MAELILMLDEPLAADEEEMLTDSDDEKEICFIGAIFIFTRRDINRITVLGPIYMVSSTRDNPPPETALASSDIYVKTVFLQPESTLTLYDYS